MAACGDPAGRAKRVEDRVVGQPASDALVGAVEPDCSELGRLDRAGRQDHAAGAEGPLLVGEQVMGGHPDHAPRVGLVDQDLPDGGSG